MTDADTQNAAALCRIAAPAPRRPAGASTGLWAAVLLAALAGAVMTIVARGDLAAGDLASNLGNAAAAVGYATLGALIVRRAGNVIGWIMLGEGAAWPTGSPPSAPSTSAPSPGTAPPSAAGYPSPSGRQRRRRRLSSRGRWSHRPVQEEQSRTVAVRTGTASPSPIRPARAPSAQGAVAISRQLRSDAATRRDRGCSECL
jgi:hypothetical protein